MSTDRRQACTGPDGPTPRQTLPLDLLLEFAARADATTLVRVAATSKSLRRGILGADFRRRLLAVRAAGRWFDPALLRGVSHTFLDSTGVYDTEVIATYQSAPPRIIDRDILLDLAPVASRDGFLVQRSRVIEEGTCGHMCVCDTLTGHVIHLPPVSLKPGKTWHTPALLTVGAGRSFELLVANHDMEFQTFSSEAGQWSEVRAISEPQPLCIGHRAHPAVLGRTVHWFCFGVQWVSHVITLDVDATRWTMQQLPLTDMVGDFRGKEYLLAAVGGHLSLIVVESLEVSIFMLTMSLASASALAWSRQLVIRTPEIERWAGMDVDSISAFLPVGGFGERSGTLVMQLKNGDLVRLELGTKEVTTLRQGMVRIGEVFLHEIDLPSLLQAMKSY